jgi:predicted alpha-1,2-mannosidase
VFLRTVALWTFALPAFCFQLSNTAHAQDLNDLASKVDPFIGTSMSWIQDVANTVPGATVPFGMMYWSPDRSDGTFYRYEGTSTRGFSLNHLSGPGCSVYGDVPILPIPGRLQQPPPQHPSAYQGIYKPEDQVAQPGYYEVQLGSGIKVQLAAAPRSGIAKFSFSDSKDAHTVLLDLSRNLTRVNDAEIQVRGKTATGWVASDEFCGNENHYRVFFSLEIEQVPESTGTFDEFKIKPGSEMEKGPRAGGYLTFASSVTGLTLKVGISYVSIANATQNLNQEIPEWDFDKTRRQARKEWNEALGHVQVEGGTEKQQRIFYTALYHSLLHPSLFSDWSDEYIGFDEQVHRTGGRLHYANFSGWDIYRSQVQLIAMLFPKVASDMAQSLVLDAQQGGGLPIWPVANDESGVMVGDPSDQILASIYAFGGVDFDTHAALAAMLRGADEPETHIRVYPERPGLSDYLSRGYIPLRSDGKSIAGAASVTLEDVSADFAIGQFAKRLGDTANAERFLNRSTYWRNLFDSNTKYIRPRDQDGNFVSDFAPEKSEGFVEGNAAQYTWMAPHDLKGIIESLGGPEKAKARLDDYFSEYGRWTGSGYTPHFFISNEPSFGNPWIYNWTGHPWRTQEVVQKCLQDLFLDSRGGIPGNDDLGATSSWAVLAYLGIYPEIPGVGGLALSTPAFPRVTLKLGEHELRILAPGAAESTYIQRVSLDGTDLHSLWLDIDRLKRVSNLEFVLAAAASHTKWDSPPSFEPISAR